MVNLDSITNENSKQHNEKWPYIPDHPYRILAIGGSGWGKTNALLDLINEQDNIDKIYLYAKDLSEPKYEYLIKKRENAGIKHLNEPNALIECSDTMDGVYININDYNPRRKSKILIALDDMIADSKDNKKLQTIIEELFKVQKTQYFTRFYHAVLFFCSKRCKIKFNTLFDHENKQPKRVTKYCT